MITSQEELELSFIGTLVAFEDKYLDVSDIVTPADFVDERACKIYLKIQEMYGSEPVNLQSVYISLNSKEHQEYLLKATDNTIPMNTIGFARKIAENAKKRRLELHMNALTSKIKNGCSSADILAELVDIYQKESGNIKKDCSIDKVLDRLEVIQAENKKYGVGLKTGFDLLDANYMHYKPGHLWVIGAWTSVGKSALMIEAICRLIKENERAKIAVFSTEMTEDTNAARILANRTGISSHVITSGKMLDNHSDIVSKDIEKLRKTNINIYDQIRTIDGIATQCRKLNLKSGLDVVFIDFIQNVEKRGYKNKYDMMSQIAIDVQNLAHELRCTIVCLSQLPNHAGREDTGILEFKNAGEIAAACDVGVLMKRSKDDKRVILYDVRKNRHGACKKFLMKYRKGYTGIDEIKDEDSDD